MILRLEIHYEIEGATTVEELAMAQLAERQARIFAAALADALEEAGIQNVQIETAA